MILGRQRWLRDLDRGIDDAAERHARELNLEPAARDVADLLERREIEALPKLLNVVFMAGSKFGSSGHEDLTWAMNGLVPALVAEAFAGSRIVAYSTGCVYPYVNVHQGGATETTPMAHVNVNGNGEAAILEAVESIRTQNP